MSRSTEQIQRDDDYRKRVRGLETQAEWLIAHVVALEVEVDDLKNKLAEFDPREEAVRG